MFVFRFLSGETRRNRHLNPLAATCAALGLILSLALAPTASAQDAVAFDIPSQNLSSALTEYARQSGLELLYSPEIVAGKTSATVSGDMTRPNALARLLQGTGLEYEQMPSGGMMVGDEAALAAYRAERAAAAGQNTIGQRRPGIEEIIVTGQKREERIQDVPIAISAFSMEDLEAQKLEGGFDLLKAIPNVTFSKTNFTSYNFQIRGVGTQSISATSDPGVAVSLNNVGIIQNRLFEQEYLDVERVEVLRGPQGTLYGRNATAGVINVITNKPEMGVWEGMLDVEVGNYNTRRLRGHFNMPIGDTFAIRAAYASTDREGYTFNSGTGRSVDGRDLWSSRLSIGWEPDPRFRANLIWEHFEEDDDRLRTGKQLCHRDDGPTTVGETFLDASVVGPAILRDDVLRSAFSQACKPGSLFEDAAFGTPNGLAINFINPIVVLRDTGIQQVSTAIGVHPGTDNGYEAIIKAIDPYGGRMQSRDLREIESIRDPVYRAKADLIQLNVDLELTETLMLFSQTLYNNDETYSFQDFNRFNTDPTFTDTSVLWPSFGGGAPPGTGFGLDFSALAPGGIFCDPQIGCSDKIAGFDIAQGSAEQFNQEFRLQSSFAGPVNFSLGANYTEFDTVIDYYVMYNVITALAWSMPFNRPRVWDPETCYTNKYWGKNPDLQPGFMPVPLDDPDSSCPYVDPNPLDTSENFEGDGHNYFRSKNPYKLESLAGFGELYWSIQDDLKLTLGLRYTDDRKTFIPVPTQVLLSKSAHTGGTVSKGYPEDPPIKQKWGEWTGRIVLDWQPILSFTDETLLYGSFSRGYKGGGANPPTPGFATAEESDAIQLEQGMDPFIIDLINTFDVFPVLETQGGYGETFDAEFVNAYEIGTKNTLFGGAVTLNATAFYYDYTDYQVSQIRDRTAVNENFDSEMWGLELETVFVPSPNWQFLANVGYLKTKIAEGETSIDIMNRTQGNPDYALAKPWPQLPSNCVVPTDVAESWLNMAGGSGTFSMCGIGGVLGLFTVPIIDPATGQPYDVDNYPELNDGAGLSADLGGNELPQSPRFTVTLGGQYSFDVTPEWRGTVRMDYYWQDESYHRVYNTEPYDRLKSWSNTNLSFWVNNANTGITVEAYVKNLFNQTPITGAFLNSDDTGLTTNVFMFDPRLIGVSVRKEW